MCTKSGAGLALEAMRLVPQSVGLARLAPPVHLFALLLAHQSAPSALIVEGVKAKYGHESARQTFRPVSSILLIVPIQQTFRFSRNPSHYPN